ncbi:MULTISPECIES: ABC transporter ATP-binding protein [Actinomadura]|uniref:ABC transporter ATP-binding protein n=1 Tax=Actinomadura yumaensis TaxID=111807 RepID=A0ABW2CJR7_9ACTN|nr:ABC transporter ATP-binding protein [Actinomadura sp. J1-007]MWK40076.1 ATP-binding cassette domain-containing protein [Actinomadura sp. J1-007]
MSEPVVRLVGVSKRYGDGPGAVDALRGLSMDFAMGTFTAVMGPSGSGKSTFLQCAAGLDRPSSGGVLLGGVDVGALREPALTKVRRERVGFVFQAFNLVPSLTVWQNVTLPLRLAGVRGGEAAARDLIERVGLGGRAGHRPAELSGGQQQRAAVARALVTRPRVVFADEPTGNLDTRSGHGVLRLLRESAGGAAVIMVTHDPVAASYADRALFLVDGRFVDAMERPDAAGVAHRMAHLEEAR